MYKKIIGLLAISLFFNACTSKEDKIEELLKITEDNMVFVKGGSFLMGDFGAIRIKDKYGYYLVASPENIKKYPNEDVYKIRAEADANTLHKVTLDDFYISKYETTYKEFDLYKEIIGEDLVDKKFIGKQWRSDKMPVRAPTWYEAKNYCKYLAKLTGKDYDLVSEAQWEYAARSRGKYVYYATNTGREVSDRRTLINEPQNVADKRSPVGSFPPNSLGLYDMSGNLWEWVNDWYDKDYYKKSPEYNPRGPKEGEKKVVRGGSVSTSNLDAMTFNRHKKKLTSYANAFRCVLNPKK